MFSHFDFRVLGDPSFKEDAVREELLAPILRRLGYTPSGPAKVMRSTPLEHPFFRIGTKKYPVKIVPDYTLVVAGKCALVIDAKRPTESVTAPSHVEQAYSYAIHPDVRAPEFALCNGHNIAIYSAATTERIALLSVPDAEEQWHEFVKFLSPRYLAEPKLREFWPDLGLKLSMLGATTGSDVPLAGVTLQYLGRVADDLYTATASFAVEGEDHLANFDMAPSHLPSILECLPSTVRNATENALSRAPFQVSLDLVIEVDLSAKLGERTSGLHDMFIPFVVDGVLASRVSYPPPAFAADIPGHIFRLSDALKAHFSGSASYAFKRTAGREFGVF